MKEILLKVDNNIFALKTAGICISNNCLLLKKHKNGTYSFPGGQISFNENSKDALHRKFSEETNATVYISELKFVTEDFITVNNSPCHEICFYYKSTILNKELLMTKTFDSVKGNDESFQWVPINEVTSLKIKCNNLSEIVNNIQSADLKHIYVNPD